MDSEDVEDKAGAGVKYYRCQRGSSDGCLGRGILRDGQFDLTRSHDQHRGDKVKMGKYKLRSTQ